MNALRFDFDWLVSGNDAPEIRQTMGMFRLLVDDTSLTENEDFWSQTVRPSVLVSAYPLAQWIASSWWRLCYEPLPPGGTKPVVAWRMAHELSAANEGFLWPRVIFASDSETMQVWLPPPQAANGQSVRYLQSLNQPHRIPFPTFEGELSRLVDAVLSRLDTLGIVDTALAGLWGEVQEERADAASRRYRRCEAELGFDADECPEDIVEDALRLAERMGGPTLSEVAPYFGRGLSDSRPLSQSIDELTASIALQGAPDIDRSSAADGSQAPWQRGVTMADQLRRSLDADKAPLTTRRLCELLGLRQVDYESWMPSGRRLPLSLAVPAGGGTLNFHPRKSHPVARRFELARFVGDYLDYSRDSAAWLANTDLRTSRQKFQRAFAAELLCPLDGLQSFLEGDYSEGAIEDAAAHFDVSPQTVVSMLANNGLIPAVQSIDDFGIGSPY